MYVELGIRMTFNNKTFREKQMKFHTVMATPILIFNFINSKMNRSGRSCRNELMINKMIKFNS